ncbi:hypothetical protein HYZ97_01210 [Candidatus Pacearchaeota archaeon]|nr:hypothetical protein [Candidatus Pacearchaeota archaeon]
MLIKLKHRGFWGEVKREEAVSIHNIVLKEDLLNPEKERISIFFRGAGTSGILELKREEAQALANSIKPALPMVQVKKAAPTVSVKRARRKRRT